jgi:plasmid stabilization system protein ParE
VKVELTENAKKQLKKQRSWWRKNRDEKTLFTEEFVEARKRLKNPPKLQVYGAFQGEAVRRLLMEKVHAHVYFIILEELETVRIISVWGTKRGSPADLG